MTRRTPPPRRAPRVSRAAALLPLAAAGCTTADPLPDAAARAVLPVVVAANLRPVFPALEQAFEARHPGIDVRATFTSTGTAYRQLLAGAPFAVLVAADTLRPAALVRAGRARAEHRVTYARGTLVLWLAPGVPPRVRTLADLVDPVVRRVAIATPAAAPYGAAAEHALASAGVLDAVRPRLVFGQDVAQAAQIATAGADAALLPPALATALPRAGGRTVPIPDSLHPPVLQGAVAVGADPSPAARAFVAWLGSGEARDRLAGLGYRAP